IMLLNHAPLIVAEQFETLETLYPRRIDLGLGRAPETDMLTSRRCVGPWKPTLLHLRMRVGTSTLFRRCGRGGGLSAQFQAPACRFHCLFWVRAYSGQRCRPC